MTLADGQTENGEEEEEEVEEDSPSTNANPWEKFAPECTYEDWGKDMDMCPRKADNNFTKEEVKMPGVAPTEFATNIEDIAEHLFFRKYLETKMLPAMNEANSLLKATISDLLIVFGIRLMMALYCQTKVTYFFGYKDSQKIHSDEACFCQGWISILEEWRPRNWNVRQFAYFLESYEANVIHAYNYFFHRARPDWYPKLSQREARYRIAMKLINMGRIIETRNNRSSVKSPSRSNIKLDRHQERVLQPVTGKWEANREIFPDVKSKYQQYRCGAMKNGKRCGKLTRIYCICNKSKMLCKKCFIEHLRRQDLEDYDETPPSKKSKI